jgi:hypothetical protein
LRAGRTERADVLDFDGVIHMPGISAFDDPIELADTEVRLFAKYLNQQLRMQNEFNSNE